MPFNLRSNVVYKFLCGRCNATYYGKTCEHLNIRIGDHSGVSSLTGKKSKAKTTTSFKELVLFCDHVVLFEDFKISASSKLIFQRLTVSWKLFSGRFINAAMAAHASSIAEYRRAALGNNFTLGSGITKYASPN